MKNTVAVIDKLCSESSGNLQNYGNQIHKHTFTCYKKADDKCRFNIRVPYWPMGPTRVLIPVTSDDGRRAGYKKKASKMRQYLELKTYYTMKAFWEGHNVKDLEEYLNIIRASISRSSVMIKRQMTELWTNTFHPRIANVLNSNMDLEFILEEYSFAAYVVEYVNKTNRGISNLHTELIKLQNEDLDQDYTSLLRGGDLTPLEQPRDEFSRSCVVSPKTTYFGSQQGYRKHSEVLVPRASKNAKNFQANGRGKSHGRIYKCVVRQHRTQI
jgi:hypothetical protein